MIEDFERIRASVLVLDLRRTERKWWARLRFRVTGRWPQRVVDERLQESELIRKRLACSRLNGRMT